MASEPEAIVVGSGPNGLAAAVTLARAGLRVRVVEAHPVAGGGTRTSELTLLGFRHDVCSAVHPLAAASPFFRQLDLARDGLAWVQPPVPLAHPLDGGRVALLHRSLDETAAGLGDDGATYRALVAPLLAGFAHLTEDLLGPLRVPQHPLLAARFGLRALRSARHVALDRFTTVPARALFAGLAAHSMLPLEDSLSAAVGFVLAAAAHAVGWPFARGGSQRIAEALIADLRRHGGELVTGRRIEDLAEVDGALALLDVAPGALARIAGARLSDSYRARLARFRHGPGVFKLDLALDAPAPWQHPACALAGTVHAGGTYEEIAAAERAVARGEHPEQPFVLVAQPSLFDPTRAPAGKHVVWAYCHVPSGSTVDMTLRIEAQIERFAPGFRSRILARASMTAAALERYDANYVGGDVGGGVQDLAQLFTRPIVRLDPYATPLRNVFLCSSSTPPGAGVHGLCGYFAATSALRRRGVHAGGGANRR